MHGVRVRTRKVMQKRIVQGDEKTKCKAASRGRMTACTAGIYISVLITKEALYAPQPRTKFTPSISVAITVNRLDRSQPCS